MLSRSHSCTSGSVFPAGEYAVGYEEDTVGCSRWFQDQAACMRGLAFVQAPAAHSDAGDSSFDWCNRDWQKGTKHRFMAVL